MTPDTQLSILNWQNQPVRIIQEQDKAYIPVVDIALAVGMLKRPLLGILDRNPKEFSSHERSVSINTPGGKQQTRCLDYPGTIGLLFKVSTNHLKDDLTRERLVGFRQYMIENRSPPVPQLPPAPKEPDFDLVLKKLKFVRSVHEETGWDLTDMQKRVLEDAGFYSITPVADIPRSISTPEPLPKPKDYFTATDIGERIGKSAHEVNMFLYQHKPPFLIKDQKGEWRLTEYGKEFGEERMYEVSGGYFMWRIKWKKDILEKFNIGEKMG